MLALLTKVGLSHPEQRIDQYPHQLSGGMKQRVLIAIAIALKPDLIIADEPTSALDVTVQKRILDLLDTLRRESGTAVLFVTHDLALAAERADRLLVFRHGEIQEQGATGDVIRTPQHTYTRQLLSDLQGSTLTIAPASGRVLATPAIRVEGISKRFSLGSAHLQALDAVSFEVKRGSTHALVGESGSGKRPLRGSCWDSKRPIAAISLSTVSMPGISAARRSASCGVKFSSFTRILCLAGPAANAV